MRRKIPNKWHILSVALLVLGSCGAWPQDKKGAECVAQLSGFPPDAPTATPPYPADFGGVVLRYFELGCLGDCPVFRMMLTAGSVQFEGRSHVRVVGKRVTKLSQAEFGKFLRLWFDGRLYAMRDNYCGVKCPDGSMRVAVDLPESSITLTTPELSKEVYQCFAIGDGKPETPKPPDSYFHLAQEIQTLARQHGWL